MRNVKLNNVDYVCLKMLLNPGQTQRFYLRALATYRGIYRGREEMNTGRGCSLMFSRDRPWRDVLYEDRATPSCPEGHGKFKRPNRGEFHLLPAGVERARLAAEKIGMKLEHAGA
jgi:hypothetical protein